MGRSMASRPPADATMLLWKTNLKESNSKIISDMDQVVRNMHSSIDSKSEDGGTPRTTTTRRS